MFARQSLGFIVRVHLVDCRIEMIYPWSMKWIFVKNQKLVPVAVLVRSQDDTRTRQWIRGWSCCLSILQSLKPNTSKSTLTSQFGSNHSGHVACRYTMYLLHMNAEACKLQEFVNFRSDFYLMTLLVMLLHMKTCPDMDAVARLWWVAMKMVGQRV